MVNEILTKHQKKRCWIDCTVECNSCIIDRYSLLILFTFIHMRLHTRDRFHKALSIPTKSGEMAFYQATTWKFPSDSGSNFKSLLRFYLHSISVTLIFMWTNERVFSFHLFVFKAANERSVSVVSVYYLLYFHVSLNLLACTVRINTHFNCFSPKS